MYHVCRGQSPVETQVGANQLAKRSRGHVALLWGRETCDVLVLRRLRYAGAVRGAAKTGRVREDDKHKPHVAYWNMKQNKNI